MSVLLECKDVSKVFGGLRAIDSVSFCIQEGEIVGVIGPNGAGKTTLFNVCTGTFLPTSGKIIFTGKDISNYPPDKIAELGMARTFQNIKLFRNMSALENVKLGFHVQLKTNLFDPKSSESVCSLSKSLT